MQTDSDTDQVESRESADGRDPISMPRIPMNNRAVLALGDLGLPAGTDDGQGMAGEDQHEGPEPTKDAVTTMQAATGIMSAPREGQPDSGKGSARGLTAAEKETATKERRRRGVGKRQRGKESDEYSGSRRRQGQDGDGPERIAQEEVPPTQMCECRCGRCLHFATKCMKGWYRGERPQPQDCAVTRGSPSGVFRQPVAHAHDGHEWNKTLYLCDYCHKS